MTAGGERPVRLAELVATLSLVADLGLGQPMEHVLRQTRIAMRLASAAGLAEPDRAATYYVGLLAWVGCAADTSDLARLFGDETDLYAGTYDVDLAGVPAARFFASHLGAGRSPLQRAGMLGSFVATAGRSVREVMTSHCLAAGDLAARLDLGEDVRRPLLQAFERWDGRGTPGRARGEQLAPAIRVVQLADTVETLHRVRGVRAALEVATARRGTRFDPDLVDCFRDAHADLLDGLDESTSWDEVIAADPSLGRTLGGTELDTALEALADFADLKSPHRVGHSRGVAALAASTAGHLGLPGGDVDGVRRAGLVHDLGIIGVPSGVWDEARPWSESQRERARTHPYLTERMLARAWSLSELGRCAALHHERLDGSGYPRGLTGEAIPMPARILAAADVYHALGEPRPHRPPVDRAAAAATLRAEVRAGRLDGDAANAVLAAGGHRVRRRAGLPGGLTPREAEVVVLVARGRSNPDIAHALSVSRKTVSSHLEHIYTKLGVSTRTEAALFAMRHGLAGDPGGAERAKT
ncbi:MAG TPA: HD domain-containing phosphohydrolase [Acidimicrobiales bacterium]|nr:HD domain-containing phosphohydrolase [Acidimicrobiales bacterium]